MDLKLALIVALIVITVFYAISWYTMARRKRASGEHGHHEPVMPTPLQTGDRVHHQLLRHARHRLVRDDDGDVPGVEDRPRRTDSGHTQRRPRAADGHPGNHLHPTRRSGGRDALPADRRGLRRRVAWRRNRGGLPRRSVQVGMGGLLFVAATLLLITAVRSPSSRRRRPSIRFCRRRRRARPDGRQAGDRSRRQLRARRADDARDRPLCALHDPDQHARDEPAAAFPIMMGSCAFLMPVGSLQFVRKNRYNLRAALGLALGGPLAVLIAAFIVECLPLLYVRWLVVVVVVYTARRCCAPPPARRRRPPRAKTRPPKARAARLRRAGPSLRIGQGADKPRRGSAASRLAPPTCARSDAPCSEGALLCEAEPCARAKRRAPCFSEGERDVRPARARASPQRALSSSAGEVRAARMSDGAVAASAARRTAAPASVNGIVGAPPVPRPSARAAREPSA